jgi:hypothetical protein
MDITEKIKELVGEEKKDEFEKLLGDKKLILNDGSFIPKALLDEEIDKKKAALAEVDELKKSAKETTAEIDKLKQAAGKDKELTAKITELQETLKTKEKEVTETRKKLVIEARKKELLLNAGVRKEDVELLLGKFDESKIAVSDDYSSVSGLDNQVDKIKEAHPKLFDQDTIIGTEHNQGGGNHGLYTKEQVEKMSVEEVLADYDKVMESQKSWE